MPFGTDQVLNIGRATGAGFAVKLDWKDVTQENLSQAIQDLLHNSRYLISNRFCISSKIKTRKTFAISYKTTVKKLSGLFRDQIEPPLERAVFWTEFVLRHNGTNHLRLGSVDLAPYQRNLVDVYFILTLCAIVPLLLIYFLVRKCCCRPSINLEKKKK